jgi:hypothetical protein
MNVYCMGLLRFVTDVRPLVEGATETKQRELARLIYAIYRPYVARLTHPAIAMQISPFLGVIK